MKIGNYWVEAIGDCGENEGGYFCRIYDNEDNYNKFEGWADTHCVTVDELNNNFGSLEETLRFYLGC